MSTKRQKTVFTTDELPHTFAHQSAPFGRAPGNSHTSFRGNKFYSYSTCIAILAEGKSGLKAVIRDTASFSISTSRHQGGVSSATSHLKNFTVDIGGVGCGLRSFEDSENIGAKLRDYYLSIYRGENDYISPAEDDRLKSRYAHIRSGEFLRRVHHLDKAIDACKFFGLASKKLESERAKLADKIADAEKIVNDKEAVNKARRDKRDAERAESRRLSDILERERAVRRAKAFIAGTPDPKIGHNADWFGCSDYLLNDQPELLAQVVAKREQRDADKLAAWEAGDTTVRLSYDHQARLRIEGDEVVTSKGARVPIADAERAYRFALIQRRRGWRKNGERQEVGHYELDSVSEDGVVAGCHRFSWDALESLAARAGWFTPEQDQAAKEIIDRILEERTTESHL